ncbi:MAG: branched-chain amino acid ABC transporter permease [Deltaproteobacteria bacterium]|nr:branched-chain amino acid ABC transporter permease [Candidatus Zymogenaceae bacterium]
MTIFDKLLQFFIGGITNGSIYAMVALGFTIVYHTTEIINFAQGEFVMLGALLMVSFSLIPGMPLACAFVLAVLGVTVVGILVNLLVIRPVRNPNHISLIIITIGASIFIRGIAMQSWAWGKGEYASTPFSGETPILIGNAAMTPQAIWIIGITLTILMLLHFFFENTITGKGMRACAVNPRAASLMGIKVSRMVVITFALSGMLGAVAGIIITPTTTASYKMGVMLGLKGFCAAIIGGLGSIPGAIIGGFVLGVLESMGAGLISSAYKDAIAFVALLVVLFVRPSGILGIGDIKRV